MWTTRKYISVLYMVFYWHITNAQNEGSKCTERTKGPGICRRIKDCPLAINSMARTRFPGLSRCGFIDEDEIVCCPSIIRTSNDDVIINLLPEESTETSTETISSSKKFCEKIVSDITSIPGEKIAGGQLAAQDQYPHMVALGYQTDDSKTTFRCGAAIISNKFLLTAAHCIRTKDQIKPTIARIGVTKLNETNPLDLYVKRTKIHSQYHSKTKHNDIGLVELYEELVFDKAIYPACLYFEDDIPSPLVATGWGVTDKSNSSNHLREATLDLQPHNKCKEYYSNKTIDARRIIDTQFCAKYKSGDTCKGDSGGPLQIKKDTVYYIVGIVSFGLKGCGNTDGPGVYTQVSKYIKWIDKYIYENIN